MPVGLARSDCESTSVDVVLICCPLAGQSIHDFALDQEDPELRFVGPDQLGHLPESLKTSCIRDFPRPVSANIAARPRRSAHDVMASWCGKRVEGREKPPLIPVHGGLLSFELTNS